MNVGERIRQRRIELGLTQEELAKRLGYASRSSVNKMEVARDLPLKKVEAMATALMVSPSYLMGWEPVKLHKFSLDSFYESKEGHKLISSYLSLNEDGRNRLLEYCGFLASSEQYYRGTPMEFGQLTILPGEYTVPFEEKTVLNAAHERTDIETTEEMKKHDDDIMDDDDF